jgi:hypothetical protein
MGSEKINSRLLEDLIRQKKIIYSYIRTPDRNKKIGMLVAWKDNRYNSCISYSLLNPGDKFNKFDGLEEAMNKFYQNQNSYLLSENKAILIDYELALKFIRRTLQYFKDSNISIHLPVLRREIHAKSES